MQESCIFKRMFSEFFTQTEKEKFHFSVIEKNRFSVEWSGLTQLEIIKKTPFLRNYINHFWINSKKKNQRIYKAHSAEPHILQQRITQMAGFVENN